MLSQVSIVLISAIVVASSYLIGSTVFKARKALAEFKQKSRGLPLLEGANSLLANHAIQFHLGPNICNKLLAAHSKLGPTFGLLYGTRPCVSTTELDLIKLIVHDEPLDHINRMPFNTALLVFEHDQIFMAEGEQWRRIRRAFGPSLRKFKMPNMVEEIERSVDNMIESLDRKLSLANASGNKSSVQLEADNLIHRYSQDVVFRCLYKQPNLIDYNTEHCEWVDVIDEALSEGFKLFPPKLCLIFPSLIPLSDWIVKRFTKFGHWQAKLMLFIKLQTRQAIEARKYLAERKRRDEKQVNFDEDNFQLSDGTQFKRSVIDFIMDFYLDGKLTRSEYINSSFFLFNAADKTVADAMTHAIYLLATNQQVQDKLRQSLFEQAIDSEYLTWVIHESIRLHPPAAIGCSRTITRDIPIANGHLLPAGTYVHTNSYVIGRLTKYWGEDANEFKPERWARASEFHPMQFLAFGAGRRGCPGKELAIFEMKTLLTRLLTKYQITGEKRHDVCEFHSPYMLYTLPNSPTIIQISPLKQTN